MSDPFLESSHERRRQIASTLQLFAYASIPQVSLQNDWVVRSVTETEIATLCGPSCRCKCRDWSKIRLMLHKDVATTDQSVQLKTLVTDSNFTGVVVLGLPSEAEREEIGQLPPGVHSNMLISNCILEPHCRVYGNAMICQSHVCSHALVMSCGEISAKKANYGLMNVTVGAQSGGERKLTVNAESTMIDVCHDLMAPRNTCGVNNPESLNQDAITCDFNILGPHSMVRNTSTIQNVYLASHASIEAATAVTNAVLLSNAIVSNASTATNVCLQWNAAISDQSNVVDTLLMEEACAGPHSTCASSILGPDVHISTGEVHASVVGPNTNSHHQSLLISVLWPLGRGNVGYGANVGSNHTGRIPDQETCAGEGTFLGLSSVVKFPVNLLESPYSLVAAGTTLIPQRICMPFSLLVDGEEGMCQIMPGWVLSSSPYTLLRSEQKFSKRRQAKRHMHYTGYKIMRPDIIDMCLAARYSLSSVTSKASVYKTERDIFGIGKCYLTEKSRQAGIDSYTRCIRRYSLRGLLDRVISLEASGSDVMAVLNRELSLPPVSRVYVINPKVSWPALPWQANDFTLWNHRRAILLEEFPLPRSSCVSSSYVSELLLKLVKIEKDYAREVYLCKKRDDSRGEKTIPSYDENHVSAEDDSVIVLADQEAQRVEESVNEILAAFRSRNLSTKCTIETRSRL